MNKVIVYNHKLLGLTCINVSITYPDNIKVFYNETGFGFREISVREFLDMKKYFKSNKKDDILFDFLKKNPEFVI